MLTTDNVMIGNSKFCGRYLNPMDGGGAESDATVCCKFFYTRFEPNLTQSTLISLITVEVGINVEGVQKLQNQ